MNNDYFGRLKKDSTVFLCVDLQEKLFALMHAKEKLLKNASILVQAAKIMEVPMLVTEQYPKGLGKTIPDLSSQFHAKQKVFEKLEFSALGNRIISSALPPAPHTLVIFGIEAHICVLQTALDAKAAGYDVHVVADATSSRTEENLRLALDRMGQSGIYIVPTETLLFQLLGTANPEEFKAVQALIK